jgi:hypothetical protein
MKNKVLFLWIGLILGFCLGWAFTTVVPKLSREAGEKEAFAIMGALHNANEVAKRELGFYPQTYKEIGFEPTGELRWKSYYYSVGEDYSQCVVSIETGQSFFKTSSLGIEENNIEACAQVIVNSEKDPGNKVPDSPYKF